MNKKENIEPRTPEKHEQTRRAFLKMGTGAVASFAGLIFAVPFLDSLISQSMRVKIGKFVKVGPVLFLPDGVPEKMFFDERDEDAYIDEVERRDVWVVKNGDDVTAFSPVCPHLGCRYNWNAEDQHFVCPCHGSVFSKDGKVLHGPAPRGLDKFPTKVSNGFLSVKWERFKLGVSKRELV